MKFFYKLDSKSGINIDLLLQGLTTIKDENSNIINLMVEPFSKISQLPKGGRLTKRLFVEFPPLYCTSNQSQTNNKYVCHELLLSLMSTNELDTKRINYFLSKLENICMTLIKTKKMELFNTSDILIFKSTILSIDTVKQSDEKKNNGLIEKTNIKNTSSSDNYRMTTNIPTPILTPTPTPSLTPTNISTSSSNHFDSDKEYATYSDSKQIIHNHNNININGGLKLKIINSATFSTLVTDENNKILDPTEYTEAFNRNCFVIPSVLISLWRYKNVVGLYLRPYKIQLKNEIF